MCDILFVRSRKARPSSVPPKLDFGGDSQHCCPPSQNFGGESPSLSPHDLHHWGIYVLCYCTKLENLTFNFTANFYHLQGLWLEGCLKMHFLQVKCKYSMIFKNKITLFNFFKWLSEGAGTPLDPPLVRMHRGNCNLRIAYSKLCVIYSF